MSLADRPIICKKLQFLVTHMILSIWIQDSRFKAQKKLLPIQPLWIQDNSRLRKKKTLQSNLFGFKIQDSRLRKNFFNPNLFGFKIQDSRLKALGFKKFFWDLESWIRPPWVQEVFLDFESWILNPTSWILNPMYLGKGGMGTNLQQKML